MPPGLGRDPGDGGVEPQIDFSGPAGDGYAPGRLQEFVGVEVRRYGVALLQHLDILDAVDLEGAHPARLAAVPDHVVGVLEGGGLYEVGLDHPLPGLRASQRLVGYLDPASVDPGVGQRVHDAPQPVVFVQLVHPAYGASHLVPQGRRHGRVELDEGGADAGVVGVGVGEQQARGQEDGHGLGQGEGDQWQEVGLFDAAQRPLLPDGHADLFQCLQVAPRRAFADVALLGDLPDGQALAELVEDVLDADQPRQPVVLVLPHYSHPLSLKNYTICACRPGPPDDRKKVTHGCHVPVVKYS